MFPVCYVDNEQMVCIGNITHRFLMQRSYLVATFRIPTALCHWMTWKCVGRRSKKRQRRVGTRSLSWS